MTSLCHHNRRGNHVQRRSLFGVNGEMLVSIDREHWIDGEKMDLFRKIRLHCRSTLTRGGTNRNVTYIFIHTTALDTQKNESSSSIKSWRHVSITLSRVWFSFIYYCDVTYCRLLFYICNSIDLGPLYMFVFSTLNLSSMHY